MGNIDENEAAYLSWFYSKRLDSEWEMKLTDKQKKNLEKTIDVRNALPLTPEQLREKLFGKDQ